MPSVFAEARPNVLLLFIDDLKPMTRDYGHGQMETPNFDRLARSGLRFENAYYQVPTCGASRASLMTSLYPTIRRFPDFLNWAEVDALEQPTLPQRFKEAGYVTVSNGKVFHHQEDTDARSWSEPAWRPETGGTTFYNDETAAHRDHAYTLFESGDAISAKDHFYVSWNSKEIGKESLLIGRVNDPEGSHNVSADAALATAMTELEAKVQEKIREARSLPLPPQVAGTTVDIEATIRSENPQGVVISHGGLAYGYTLHFVEGRPALSVRNGKELYQLISDKPVRGRVQLAARIGVKQLIPRVNGKVAKGEPSGLLKRQPVGGVSVGMDRKIRSVIAPVPMFFGERSFRFVCEPASPRSSRRRCRLRPKPQSRRREKKVIAKNGGDHAGSKACARVLIVSIRLTGCVCMNPAGTASPVRNRWRGAAVIHGGTESSPPGEKFFQKKDPDRDSDTGQIPNFSRYSFFLLLKENQSAI